MTLSPRARNRLETIRRQLMRYLQTPWPTPTTWRKSGRGRETHMTHKIRQWQHERRCIQETSEAKNWRNYPLTAQDDQGLWWLLDHHRKEPGTDTPYTPRGP